jgi:Ca2+-binding RTX toxin-like protein
VTGGNGADTFYGTAGGNSLSGLPGDDLLAGRGGADTLVADEGKDWLNGGTGADTLNLNEAAAARDVVIYKTIGDSGLVFYLDDIVGFDPARSQPPTAAICRRSTPILPSPATRPSPSAAAAASFRPAAK